ncbi:MAG: AraC family transcriptional regulator [Rhodobacteraceae bacterium]|nr:AraC family transcriptional regulator [Paracoccaceae bacterium]
MITSNPTYERRILRVLGHIHDNLDGDLSLDTLAKVACMSPFHWHRVFFGITGETLAACIRRTRMDRATFLLLQTEYSVAEIAARCGYGNVQSFARSFQADYGLTPAKFRKSEINYRASETPQQNSPKSFDIKIRQQPGFRLVVESHSGDYQFLGSTLAQLHARMVLRGMATDDIPVITVLHDDPFLVAEPELRSDAGFVIPTDYPLPAEFKDTTIAPARCAVLHFKGPYVGLFEAYRYLYGHWVPQNGVELADAPIYAVIIDDPRTVSPNELRTDICLPLAG